MANEREKQEVVRQLGHEEDLGLPGGGKGRVETTGTSPWTPPEGTFPPGEAYYESGHSGVMLPEQFVEKVADQGAGPHASIDAVRVDHHWVLVKGLHVLAHRGTTGFSSPSPGIPLWDSCWSGEHWESTTHAAKRFANRLEAETYLNEHRRQMEQTPAPTPER
ncbi:MAG TPA: hypothetical protein VG826_35760 [Pirellulales bacterium]|nr:hypothetical protein [Pirellulales bacterium]